MVPARRRPSLLSGLGRSPGGGVAPPTAVRDMRGGRCANAAWREKCSWDAGYRGDDAIAEILKREGVETLIGYEPSPGTVVYLGYTRDMDDTGEDD